MKKLYTFAILILGSFSVAAKAYKGHDDFTNKIAEPAAVIGFSSFYVTNNNNNALLSWNTAAELNNNNFEIQKSTNGADWHVIVIVMGTGTAATASQYVYTDKNVTAARTYYRIRQVQLDDNFAYSTIKQVAANNNVQAAKIYTTGKTVSIELNGGTKNNITVSITDMVGKLVYQQKYDEPLNKIVLNNLNLEGLYVVSVTEGRELTASAKVIL